MSDNRSIPLLLKAAYMKALEKNPRITKSLTSFTLMAVGDIIAQLIGSKSNSQGLDLRRTCKFASFGLISAQMYHFWYIFLDKLFSGRSDLTTVMVQTAIDQFIFSPLFFIIYYAYMALLNGNWSELQSKLGKELVTVSIASAKVWVPVQFINFKYIPSEFRVLFGNVVALGWNIYFSLRDNSSN